MKFEPEGLPRLIVTRMDEMFLSGGALLDLMTDVLATGSALRFKARGWSMTPFIRDGDVITIVPITMDRCRLGEVVAFTHPETGHLVVHRIIGGNGSDYLIQGDSAVDETDGIISHDQLLGKVSRVERDGRRVRLGIGAERMVIAWLTREGYLVRLRQHTAVWFSKVKRIISR